MKEADWMEAFACHPRIGERKAAHAQRKVSRVVDAGAIVGCQRCGERCWQKLPKATRATNSASASPILCAPPERARKRCSAILKRRLDQQSRSRIARGRRTATPDYADSSGKVAGGMSAITTHVLDAVLGKPAAGISVRLEKRTATCGAQYRNSVTDADGRCRDLAQRCRPGVYRLTFETGAYLARHGPRRASIRRFQSPLSATATSTITCRCC